jgi:hypothetical protein
MEPSRIGTILNVDDGSKEKAGHDDGAEKFGETGVVRLFVWAHEASA